ncbi:sensor histidine kinase [Methanoculleus taiwanensis]|uniref:sensor histidine kinase n=1 Tax=Methanoculleus taiwanensis TaxID=1550565 RepID=UPI000FFE7CEC|nr:GAF domain-containing sensor histidine kinase [Methanoculleus taiwanensis]
MTDPTLPFDPAEALARLTVPLLVLDGAGRPVYTNPALNLLFPEDRDEAVRALSEGDLREGYRTAAWRGRAGDLRSFAVESRLLPVTRDGQGEHILLTVTETGPAAVVEEELHSCNRRIGVINRIMRASASPVASGEVLQTVLQQTVELMDFDAGAVYLVDPRFKRADLKAFFGLYDLYFPDVLTVDICTPHYREVFLEGRPCYAEKYLNVSHESGELGVFSLAGIPVTVGGRVIGSIHIASSSFHRFTDLEKSTLEAIGEEVGGVISRAMLQERLEAASREANLYLDLMTHDINNANAVALGYTEVLEELAGDAEREYVRRVRVGIEQSSAIIAGVSRLRSLRDPEARLRPVNLDAAIRTAIGHYPGAHVRYTGTAVTVWADDLLPEVFGNLIGNALKFGGTDVAITIGVEERDGEVTVVVGDTGPGIPDALKDAVFNRFQRGESREPGSGLGLYISRMLVERYDGDIRAENRVPGDTGAGTAILVRLKPAPV